MKAVMYLSNLERNSGALFILRDLGGRVDAFIGPRSFQSDAVTC